MKIESTKTPQMQINNHSSRKQCSKIVQALERAGSAGMSTIELREEIDILHPAGRVQELRESGYRIDTIWTVTTNAQGHNHRCARYVLHGKRGRATCD